MENTEVISTVAVITIKIDLEAPRCPDTRIDIRKVDFQNHAGNTFYLKDRKWSLWYLFFTFVVLGVAVGWLSFRLASLLYHFMFR